MGGRKQGRNNEERLSLKQKLTHLRETVVKGGDAAGGS